MNPYDLAHQLARALKESSEFRHWRETRDSAYENETNEALIKEYKRLQFQMQVSMASGGQPNEDEVQRLTQIAQVLQFSPECRDYMMAELTLQKMLADIYKIIGEAAGIDLDALTQ